MRISDWRSDVCSSDLPAFPVTPGRAQVRSYEDRLREDLREKLSRIITARQPPGSRTGWPEAATASAARSPATRLRGRRCSDSAPRTCGSSATSRDACRSEVHTSELKTLMHNWYGVVYL